MKYPWKQSSKETPFIPLFSVFGRSVFLFVFLKQLYFLCCTIYPADCFVHNSLYLLILYCPPSLSALVTTSLLSISVVLLPFCFIQWFAVFLVAQTVKRLPTMWETQVQSLGWEDPLEKANPTPVLLPRKFNGWRSLVGYSLWGCKELETTERLHFTLLYF